MSPSARRLRGRRSSPSASTGRAREAPAARRSPAVDRRRPPPVADIAGAAPPSARVQLPSAVASDRALEREAYARRATPRASAPAEDGGRARARSACCGGSARRIEEIASLRGGMMQQDRTRARAARRSRSPSASSAARCTIDRELLVAMARVAHRAARRERRGDHPAATRRLRRRRRAARPPRSARRDRARRRSERRPRAAACVAPPSASSTPASTRRSREIARALLGDEHEQEAGAHGDAAGADAGFSLAAYLARLRRVEPAPVMGQVVRVVGLLVESTGPAASVGEICEVRTGRGAAAAGRGRRVPRRPAAVGAARRHGRHPARRSHRLDAAASLTIPVGDALLGRVIDGLGRPIDGLRPARRRTELAPLKPPALNPLDRDPITVPIGTGVRAIDALLTCGRGQRIGVFGGSGVGKSTLLGMMARGTEADVVVLGLVGERGREVRSFLEHDLGPRGLERSVVVVSTSDSPPLARLRAAYAATAIAEAFRDAGQARAADDGLGHALCDGAARGRPRRGRAADRRRAIRRRCSRCCRGCSSARAPSATRQHHRVLHRARRRRRSQRADRRRGARHPRRPHRARRAIWRRAITIRRSTSCTASAGRCRTSRRSTIARKAGAGPRVAGDAPRQRRSRQRRRLRARQQSRASTRALARRDAIDRFLCQSADTAGRLPDAIAALADALTMADVPLPRGCGARPAAAAGERRRARRWRAAEARFREAEACLAAGAPNRRRGPSGADRGTQRRGTDVARSSSGTGIGLSD